MDPSTVVDQLAGRDIAIILAVAMVFMTVIMLGFLYILMRNLGIQEKNALSQQRLAQSVSKMAFALDKKVDVDREGTMLIRQLEIENKNDHTLITETLKQVHTLLQAARESQISNHKEAFSAISELRAAGREILRLARQIESKVPGAAGSPEPEVIVVETSPD